MTQQLLDYFTIANFIFILTGLLGMLAHASKKFLANELQGSIFEYVFKNNPKRTWLAIMGGLGASITIILSGQVPVQAGAFLLLAFTTGYTADSAINKEDEAK